MEVRPIAATNRPIAALLTLDTPPPGGSKWIPSVGDNVDNSITGLGNSDPREVRLEL